METTEETQVETNPVKAIRKHCLECVCGSSSEVQKCTSLNCNLYPFRLGRNPYRQARILTDEQRKAAVERFANIRKRLSGESQISDESK